MTAEIPKQLQQPDFRFIKLKPRDKIPLEKNWQTTANYPYDSPQITEHQGNIGVVCGPGKLRVIDCDKMDFAKEILPKLPPTFIVQTGRGGRHIYLTSDYDTNHTLVDKRGEYRAHNTQVVTPGSIHPSGNKYVVFDDKPMAKIPAQQLKEILMPYITTEPTLQQGAMQTKEKDTSRSGKEFRQVIRLIVLGWTKDKIFSEMMAFTKWSQATQQYREKTYQKATAWIQQKAQQKTPQTFQKKANIPDPKTCEEAEQKFQSPDLIIKLHEELSKNHLTDDSAKLLTFCVCLTAYLENPKHRQSEVLKGGSSVGKDNMIHTVLQHFPEEDWIFLTSATEAAMQDSIKEKRIIAISEVNLGNEMGANNRLMEVIKQLTEGGTSSLKKVPDAGRGWQTELTEQDQKTVIYTTTETKSDEELSTRFIVAAVGYSEEKGKIVNENTLKQFAGEVLEHQTSWIKIGIANLKKHAVIIPFWKLLPKDFFCTKDPRGMRDTKRFLSIVTAIALLYQNQRKETDKKQIIAEPFDFLAAMIISGSFFNHTYQGLGDQRLQRFIDAMNTYCDSRSTLGEEREIFPRHVIQEALDVSTNTIKSLSKGCQDLSIIRYHHTENSAPYYLRCQKGIKRVLMGVSWQELLQNFFIKGGVKIGKNMEEVLEKLDNICKMGVFVHSPGDFDTPQTDTPDTLTDEIANTNQVGFVAIEEVVDESPKDKVLEILTKNEASVSFDDLLAGSGLSEMDLVSVLRGLKVVGDAFESEPDYWRSLK